MEKCRNDILEELGPPNDRANNIADIKVTYFCIILLKRT